MPIFPSDFQTIFWLTPLLAGLAGSLHCLGMCGPILAGLSASGTAMGHKRTPWTYQMGRMSAYTAMGALFGALGKLVDMAGTLGSIQHGASWLAAGLMVAYGLYHLLGLGWIKVELPRPIHRLLGFALMRTRQGFGHGGAFLLGASTGLLPCHLLLPMEAMAAGTASLIQGALVMLLFGLGTLPALAGYGLLIQRFSQSAKARLKQLVALLMLATGLGMILYRIA